MSEIGDTIDCVSNNEQNSAIELWLERIVLATTIIFAASLVIRMSNRVTKRLLLCLMLAAVLVAMYQIATLIIEMFLMINRILMSQTVINF